KRGVVGGAEDVRFSAVLTLRHARTAVVGMATELPKHQSLALVRVGAALRYRVPVWTRTAVASIQGRHRVEEVELADIDTGATRRGAGATILFPPAPLPAP